jgi:hypothetical protein
MYAVSLAGTFIFFLALASSDESLSEVISSSRSVASWPLLFSACFSVNFCLERVFACFLALFFAFSLARLASIAGVERNHLATPTHQRAFITAGYERRNLTMGIICNNTVEVLLNSF